jgi:hypothetical protein
LKRVVLREENIAQSNDAAKLGLKCNVTDVDAIFGVP